MPHPPRKPAELVNAKPCPYCGGTDLRIVPWSDDTGDYDAIECNGCLGCAPADQWNNRQPHPHAGLNVTGVLASDATNTQTPAPEDQRHG